MNYLDVIKNFKATSEQEKTDQVVMINYINDNSENVLLRENKIAHMTSSGVILNKTRDKMLMIHHKIYDTWAWTGGHVDGDCDLMHVAMREAMEETGLLEVKALYYNNLQDNEYDEPIMTLNILTVTGHIKHGVYVNPHLHLNVAFVLEVLESDSTQVNTEETNGLKWVPISQIYTHSNEPYIVKIYEDLIKKAQKL